MRKSSGFKEVDKTKDNKDEEEYDFIDFLRGKDIKEKKDFISFLRGEEKE